MTITTATSRKPRKRVAAGPARPQYLESRDLDKVMMMMVAMLSEMSAMRDRMDTYEGLTEQDRKITTAEVENFALTPDRAKARGVRREETMRRVFRVLLEELADAEQRP